MRYAHPTPENMQRAVDKLGEIFGKSQQKDFDPHVSIRSEKQATHTSLYN